MVVRGRQGEERICFNIVFYQNQNNVVGRKVGHKWFPTKTNDQDNFQHFYGKISNVFLSFFNFLFETEKTTACSDISR